MIPNPVAIIVPDQTVFVPKYDPAISNGTSTQPKTIIKTTPAISPIGISPNPIELHTSLSFIPAAS